MTTATIHVPATEAQTRYLKSLLTKRVIDDEHAHWILCQIESGDLSKRQAHVEIDVLLSKPMRRKEAFVPMPAMKTEVALGFYTDGDNVYEVVESKQGNKYAKVLVVKTHGKQGTWAYVQGGMAHAKDWDALTVEQAAGLGKQWGVCMCCGRTLTKQESIDAGIGPICAGRL